MKNTFRILFFLSCSFFFGCRTEAEKPVAHFASEGNEVPIHYASGLSITEFEDYKIVEIKNPWPGSERAFKYLLAEENAEIPEGLQYDHKVQIPIEEIVVTSTTHIPSLEILGEENSLVGFPGLDYISSEVVRKKIKKGEITELGKNEGLNTEILLNLNPDVVVGFEIDGSNKTYSTIEKAGIPVLYNSDWTENSPLGKAEWIKFFGALFNKTEEANTFFKNVEQEYLAAKALAEKAEKSPTVLAGAMYKDQWFLPAGESWQAQFMADANADYLFSETEGTGSLSLSFESVLAEAANADFWVGPAQFTSYKEMRNASPHYEQFKAFQERDIHTFASKKGETGGVIFYELAPNRPDLVLKDLISIFHPQLLPDYETTFYKPLE